MSDRPINVIFHSAAGASCLPFVRLTGQSVVMETRMDGPKTVRQKSVIGYTTNDITEVRLRLKEQWLLRAERIKHAEQAFLDFAQSLVNHEGPGND